MPKRRPLLPLGQILAWADADQKRAGRWLGVLSGLVRGAPGET